MIKDLVLVSLVLLLVVMLLIIISQKLKIASPIFLVIAGLIISQIPNAPKFSINPDLVFLIFLPPLLFEAAWFTSWKDFYNNRKHIFSLAFGLVLITSVVVAGVASSIIPGITIATGFLLGGIISPPDAVAATSIIRKTKIPRRITSVLEGESLINDASSLIIFKFALIAVLTNTFSPQEAILSFFITATGGIAIGLAIGFLAAYILRKMPTNSNIDTIYTILIPYIIYLTAEHLEFSGVLAVVSAGLLMSYNAHRYLSHTSRIQSTSVWSSLIFIFNAAIFILLGLELPNLLKDMPRSFIYDGLKYAGILSLVITLVRAIYIFAGTYISHRIIKKDNSKIDWKEAGILSLSAMRGIVSLAAALSIPTLLNDGSSFPERSMILFVTFITILITLIGQGLLLPYIIKYLMPDEDINDIPIQQQEIIILKKIKKASLTNLIAIQSNNLNKSKLVDHYKTRLENEITLLDNKSQCVGDNSTYLSDYEEDKNIIRLMIDAERKELHNIRHEKTYDDNLIRKIENNLDYEELKITGFNH